MHMILLNEYTLSQWNKVTRTQGYLSSKKNKQRSH